MIIEDVESHDDSLLICGEDMDAHPVQEVHSVKAPQVGKIQLKIPKVSEIIKKTNEVDNKNCRSG